MLLVLNTVEDNIKRKQIWVNAKILTMKKNKKKKNIYLTGLTVFLLALTIISCSKDPDVSSTPTNTILPNDLPAAEPVPPVVVEQLVFQSGFEGNSAVVGDGGNDFGAQIERLSGLDNTLTIKNNWNKDWPNGKMQVQYTGGKDTQRFAKVVTDPTNAGNKVLHFWLNDSWIADGGALKSRVQTNLYSINPGYTEIYQSVRVFLTEDFNALKTYPSKITWCTLSEFWNNEWWIPNNSGFRITLGIGKPNSSASDLNFILNAENDGQKEVWNADNAKIKVPIGKWFKMDYYFKEGNKNTGRFWMAITPDGEATQVVFDVHDYTHNTTDPAPNGVTSFNPMKLYTGSYYVEYVKKQGKTLQIYWDDYKLWKNKKPLQ